MGAAVKADEPVDILARRLESLAIELEAALSRLDSLEARSTELAARMVIPDELRRAPLRTTVVPASDLALTAMRAAKKLRERKQDARTTARWAALKFA